jgi:hypothetical protein
MVTASLRCYRSSTARLLPVSLTLGSSPKLEEWALRVPGTRLTMCHQAAALNRFVRLFFSTSGFFFYANDVLHPQ